MLALGPQTRAGGHWEEPQPCTGLVGRNHPSHGSRHSCLAPWGAVFTQEAFSEVDTKHFSSFLCLLWDSAGAASGPEIGAGHCGSTQGPPWKLLTSCARGAEGPIPRSPVPAPAAAAAGTLLTELGAEPPSPAPGLGRDSAGTKMRNYWLSEARRT